MPSTAYGHWANARGSTRLLECTNMIRYVISYEWGDGDEGMIFNSDAPFHVPAVGDRVYLDPNLHGDGPTRTLFVVSQRVFEVQRGPPRYHAVGLDSAEREEFSIHTAYVTVRQPGLTEYPQ